MRQAARIDVNQKTIVENLRYCGYSVCVLSALGNGCPDLLVGRNGRNYLFELKDGNKSPSRQKLTDDEIAFHRRWRGQVHVVKTLTEIIDIIRGVENDNIIS